MYSLLPICQQQHCPGHVGFSFLWSGLRAVLGVGQPGSRPGRDRRGGGIITKLCPLRHLEKSPISGINMPLPIYCTTNMVLVFFIAATRVFFARMGRGWGRGSGRGCHPGAPVTWPPSLSGLKEDAVSSSVVIPCVQIISPNVCPSLSYLHSQLRSTQFLYLTFISHLKHKFNLFGKEMKPCRTRRNVSVSKLLWQVSFSR